MRITLKSVQERAEKLGHTVTWIPICGWYNIDSNVNGESCHQRNTLKEVSTYLDHIEAERSGK